MGSSSESARPVKPQKATGAQENASKFADTAYGPIRTRLRAKQLAQKPVQERLQGSDSDSRLVQPPAALQEDLADLIQSLDQYGRQGLQNKSSRSQGFADADDRSEKLWRVALMDQSDTETACSIDAETESLEESDSELEDVFQNDNH